jgi:hypothetical protein
MLERRRHAFDFGFGEAELCGLRPPFGSRGDYLPGNHTHFLRVDFKIFRDRVGETERGVCSEVGVYRFGESEIVLGIGEGADREEAEGGDKFNNKVQKVQNDSGGRTRKRAL